MCCCKYTGRNYKERFQTGLKNGRSNLFDVYNYKVNGDGKTAEYYCASEITKISTTQWFIHVEKQPDKRSITARMKTLLTTWKEFRKSPQRHFETIYTVSYCTHCTPRVVVYYNVLIGTPFTVVQAAQDWDVSRARNHQQDNTMYLRKDREWKHTKRQAFQLAEADFVFYARAFHHVSPGDPLTSEEASLYMTEGWRRSDIAGDLRFFKCFCCRQFSKHGFCSEVNWADSNKHCHHNVIVSTLLVRRLRPLWFMKACYRNPL